MGWWWSGRKQFGSFGLQRALSPLAILLTKLASFQSLRVSKNLNLIYIAMSSEKNLTIGFLNGFIQYQSSFGKDQDIILRYLFSAIFSAWKCAIMSHKPRKEESFLTANMQTCPLTRRFKINSEKLGKRVSKKWFYIEANFCNSAAEVWQVFTRSTFLNKAFCHWMNNGCTVTSKLQISMCNVLHC